MEFSFLPHLRERLYLNDRLLYHKQSKEQFFNKIALAKANKSLPSLFEKNDTPKHKRPSVLSHILP